MSEWQDRYRPKVTDPAAAVRPEISKEVETGVGLPAVLQVSSHNLTSGRPRLPLPVMGHVSPSLPTLTGCSEGFSS
jgi:hypothetical protein